MLTVERGHIIAADHQNILSALTLAIKQQSMHAATQMAVGPAPKTMRDISRFRGVLAYAEAAIKGEEFRQQTAVLHVGMHACTHAVCVYANRYSAEQYAFKTCM